MARSDQTYSLQPAHHQTFLCLTVTTRQVYSNHRHSFFSRLKNNVRRLREFIDCCWYLNSEFELQPACFCSLLLPKACFIIFLNICFEFEARQPQKIIIQYAYLDNKSL